MNTKRVGSASEAVCLAKFTSLGWTVLIPWGDNDRYDLVIDRGDGFQTIQVKTGRLVKGCIMFNAYGTTGRVGNGVERGYKSEVDYFAVVFDEKVYLVPVDEVGTKPMLRVEPALSRMPTIRWAKDYLVL